MQQAYALEPAHGPYQAQVQAPAAAPWCSQQRHLQDSAQSVHQPQHTSQGPAPRGRATVPLAGCKDSSGALVRGIHITVLMPMTAGYEAQRSAMRKHQPSLFMLEGKISSPNAGNREPRLRSMQA